MVNLYLKTFNYLDRLVLIKMIIMKKTKKLLSMLLILSGIIFFSSCESQKDEITEENTKTTVADYIKISNAFNLNDVDEATSEDENNLKSVEMPGCLTVIIHENDKILMVQRKNSGLLGGLWEFPNTYYDESPLADFTLGNDILIDSTYLQAAKHQYSHFKVDFEIYDCRIRTTWWNDYWQNFKWVSLDDMFRLPKPKVHIKAMEIAQLL